MPTRYVCPGVRYKPVIITRPSSLGVPRSATDLDPTGPGCLWRGSNRPSAKPGELRRLRRENAELRKANEIRAVVSPSIYWYFNTWTTDGIFAELN